MPEQGSDLVLWQGRLPGLFADTGCRVVCRREGGLAYEFLRQPEEVWVQEYAPPALLSEFAALLAKLELATWGWGQLRDIDPQRVASVSRWTDREIGDFFGWSDFISKRVGRRQEWFACRPGDQSGQRVILPGYSLTATDLLAEASPAGHFIAIDGTTVHVRLASGQRVSLAVQAPWQLSMLLAYAFVLAIREARS
jgi:hypothetical protein